jgi:glycosyltransferase involved in cell wall biosynthesis
MTQADPVSVDCIIPVRGRTPWLALSLSSIARQTLPAKTVIVVDDGVENTAAVAELGKALLGERFRLVKSRASGISAALNAGIQASTAHWIARMDADDVAHPERIKRQTDFLRAQSRDVMGCGTQARFINASGTALGRSTLPIEWPEIVQKIYARTCFIHSSLLINRELLLAHPYRPTMDGAEDVDLILRVAEVAQILNMPDMLLDYRIHSTQESFQARARHTAVQELAFRLARSRRSKKQDPLDAAPELAEQFIQWRLSDPAYVRSRIFLTALRYARTYLAGFDLSGFIQTLGIGFRTAPVDFSGLAICWQVSRKAGAALLQQETPFAELNVG